MPSHALGAEHNQSLRGAVKRFPYLPALDGLRGLLVFPVVLYHFTFFEPVLGYRLAIGSYLAPSMFFTLSGFLITSLLLIEYHSSARVNWTAFWNRRFRRLIPGSIAVVAFVVLIGLVFERAWPALSVSEIAAGLFSFKNWQSIHLENAGQGLKNLGPLGPYWSLAVEEQFYIGLSLVMWFATRFRSWRSVLMGVLLGIWVLSCIRLWTVHGSLIRTYFGTDTRASELVAGCLLALLVERYGWPRSKWFQVAGWGSLVLTLVAWAKLPEDSDWMLRGGLALAPILSVGLILAATQPTSAFARTFSFRPLVELGKISYPAYLIHWPVTILLKNEITHLNGWPLIFLCFAVTIALAVPLAYVIEGPIRHNRVLPGPSFFVAWAVLAGVLLGIGVLTG